MSLNRDINRLFDDLLQPSALPTMADPAVATALITPQIYGSFQRTVQLPFAADPDQVQASFENGVLSITVPKSDQQQRTHRIDVQPGSGAQGGQRASQQASQQTSQQTSQQASQQTSSPGSEQGSAQGNGGAKASGQKSEGPSSKRGQSS
jgi:hypothetical protein